MLFNRSIPRCARLAGAALLTCAFQAIATTSVAQEPRRGELYKDSRGDLAQALVSKQSTLTLVVAAARGKAALVAREAMRAGGEIRQRADDVDYLRMVLPIDQVERLVSMPAVHAAEVSVSHSDRPMVLLSRDLAGRGSERLQLAAGEQPAPSPLEWPPVLSDYPLAHPYSPLADIDALGLQSESPGFDGRGVTIAVLDGTVDPLLPELQTALTLDGRTTRKIVGYRTVIDPREQEREDVRPWVDMAARVIASAGRVVHRGESYRVPGEQHYRIGVFDESELYPIGTYFGNDINRDGNPTGSSRLFGVLWNENTGVVWVDTDQDHDFRDEAPLHDFAIEHEVGVFGRDDPATPLRESVGFAVQIDRRHHQVAINAGIYQHGTMVAGAAAANARAGTGGRVNGIAPGARLVVINHGGSSYGQIEALIDAFRDPQVDIVLLEQSAAVDGLYLLKDGRSSAALIARRLIQRYRKPLFAPADNMPGLNQASEQGVSDAAIGVGAYQSATNTLVNFGIRTTTKDGLHWVGSYGPAGNGAILPDVLAPTAIVSLYPAYARNESEHRGLYRLPPGYAMCGGTSCAAPAVAGATALLISAARQRGLRFDAESLRRALSNSARFLSGVDTYRQGHGLIQVTAAWRLLQRLQQLQQLQQQEATVNIVSEAPVRTVVGEWLERPNRGVGLYEREGWQPGTRGIRTVIFTRTSGPATPMTFRLGWDGNDGTFAAAEHVTLPLREPTPVDLIVQPLTPGVHSALLRLDHDNMPGHAYRMMTTVVAAERLGVAQDATLTYTLRMTRMEKHSIFLDVAPATAALEVDVTAPPGIALYLFAPDGRLLQNFEPAATRIVADPMPGVWEVLLDDSRGSFEYVENSPELSDDAAVTLTAESLRVAAEPRTVAVPQLRPGQAATLQVAFRNEGAAFTGAATSSALGSAFEKRHTLRDHEQQVRSIDVPPGSTRLLARIGNSIDADVDLDLYLFDCTGERCVPARSSVRAGCDEVVTLDWPAAGRWQVVVDGARVPAGTTQYDYLDVILNPGWGSVSVTDVPQLREAGARWSTSVHIWAGTEPPAGRKLYGLVGVLAGQAQTGSTIVCCDGR